LKACFQKAEEQKITGVLCTQGFCFAAPPFRDQRAERVNPDRIHNRENALQGFCFAASPIGINEQSELIPDDSLNSFLQFKCSEAELSHPELC